jgi:hypothetical protein
MLHAPAPARRAADCLYEKQKERKRRRVKAVINWDREL